MSEPVLVYCCQWPVTVALTALLAPLYSAPMIPLYTKAELVRHLQENPHSPVVVGFSPHEHVAELYCLQPLLSGRVVLFVAKRFYWTDRHLPAFCGLTSYRCCTWNSLYDRFSRGMIYRHFRWTAMAGERAIATADTPALTMEQILAGANRWLYGQMKAAGLSRCERVVILLLSENRRGGLSSRRLSHYKTSGLVKLGMTRHAGSLYRGVKVRPVLQHRLP